MITLLAAGLLPLAAALPGVFTVDDDGPADFADLASADASPLVADGDTLLVEPGSYPDTTLTKGLHILAADERGFDLGDLVVERVPSFSLVGAELTGLTLRDIPGTALVDRCRVFQLHWSGISAFRTSFVVAERCGDLVLQRSELSGTDFCYSGRSDRNQQTSSVVEPAVLLNQTDALISSCVLNGGNIDGVGGIFACESHYPGASEALYLEPGCTVVVIGSTLRAGNGPVEHQPPAIRVEGSHLVVRGGPQDLLFVHPSGIPTVILDASSSAVVGGSSLVPHWLPGEVIVPTAPQPFLTITGAPELGKPQAVELFGARGALALVLTGPSLLAPRPDPQGLTWLDPKVPTGSILVTTRGLRVPVALAWRLPPDPTLVGHAIAIQAWVGPLQQAGPWLTNPVLLRPRP